MTKQFIQVGDLNMHYELADYTDPWRSEEPETFLLHSGYCRNMEFWRAWVPLLGAKYRVLRLDPRGWGDTSKPPEGSEVSLDIMVQDAIGLMDALNIQKVHWVGDSNGGVIGFKAAHDHPDRIASLAVFNSATSMDRSTPKIYALDQPDQAAAIMKYGVEEWCRRTMDIRVTPDHAQPGIADWYAREMGKTPSYIAAAGFKVFSTLDLSDLMPNIQAPTLLILGSQSMPGRHEKMRRMEQVMPCAKLLVVNGWQHGLHFVNPGRVVPDILRFIEENVPASAH